MATEEHHHFFMRPRASTSVLRRWARPLASAHLAEIVAQALVRTARREVAVVELRERGAGNRVSIGSRMLRYLARVSPLPSSNGLVEAAAACVS